MEMMIMWGGYVVAVIIAVAAAVMLRTKVGGANQYQEQVDDLSRKLSVLEKELSGTQASLLGKEQEFKAMLQDRDEKASTLEALENDFERGNDAIVQCSILKKSHAEQTEELSEKLSVLEKELNTAKNDLIGKEQELKVVLQERDEKASELMALENDFESKIDDIVESSIDKLSHAEQSKEDAVQAAEDNYELAAEAYAQVKEQKKIIAVLQKELRG